MKMINSSLDSLREPSGSEPQFLIDFRRLCLSILMHQQSSLTHSQRMVDTVSKDRCSIQTSSQSSWNLSFIYSVQWKQWKPCWCIISGLCQWWKEVSTNQVSCSSKQTISISPLSLMKTHSSFLSLHLASIPTNTSPSHQKHQTDKFSAS